MRVLEARDRVGGRTLSQPLGADVIDLGAQWIGPTQDRVAKLARDLGVETFPQLHEGKKLLDRDGTVTPYSGLIPKLPIVHLLEAALGIARLELLARKVPTDHPDRARNAARWDAMTAEDWLSRSIRTRGAKTVLRIATEMIFGAEPRDLSFLYFLFYLRSGGGFLRLAEIEGGAQQDRLVGGAQQLSIRLGERLDGRVEMNAPVTAILQDSDGVTVRKGTEGAELRARYVILALSPSLAHRIPVTPALPAARLALQQRMPMGSVIKCVAAYKSPFWREMGLSGEAISDGSPLRAVFDDTSHDGKQPALVAFIVGDAARTFSAEPAEMRRSAVLGGLARCSASAPAPRWRTPTRTGSSTRGAGAATPA